MKLVVGLGNPGLKYRKTRHNVGFILLDKYLENVKWSNKVNSYLYETTINSQKIIFIKPKTYMNLSGIAVKEVVDYFKIQKQNILVIQDDVDMDIGKYKLKRNSSSGGHNGIKSIESHLKSNKFLRLKIGIKKETRKDTSDFVLSKLNKEDVQLIEKINTNKIIDDFINHDVTWLMNNYKK